MWQNMHRKNYETMVLLHDYWYGCSTIVHADINLLTRYTIHIRKYIVLTRAKAHDQASAQERMFSHSYSIRSDT